MRIRKIFFIFLILTCFLLGACKNNPEDELRKTVWDQLSEHTKEELSDGWKHATITTETLQAGISSVKDSSYIGKEVFRISFPSDRSYKLGNVDAFVDMKTKKVIGFGLRD
ncbi:MULTISPECIES: hypothetical protein [Bacillus]|uniref:DUF1433 domain-containing protein n=1 Tax=Bacillus pseudomycoides TaxID=64104 RepID=A0A1Y3MLK0_9BACI|nr:MULTISPECIES: hypothetical protein [Bacillus cereus group]EOP49417.1 hypothetical protein IIW_03524 [Bacillus cereus VD136]EOP64466.1 hypothetical protein KOW_02255 [Bacillus cereus VDM006]EOQ01764.1 hypothetical protein KOY_02407 [Bacillus cereus VDM021]OOG90546.1 hypothetical protein BTH41_02756 [Bacillus mycoides]MDF2083111.1 hypothetical protein [Bacillus pseudomycoides]